ncbi:MAG TPA: ABC transporter permease [Bryobacteraceae bacterium]|jgi:predicted permease|nr:ABC transporter permease [Bryobacteraceae bacterium]
MQNIWRTLNVLFRGRRQYHELDEEMRLHLELRARKLAASGMTEEESRYAARKRFGSINRLQEDCRAEWHLRFLDELRQDFTYAVRTLRRDWLFSLTTVLTLTLGIAANASIFAFIDALVLRPLSAPDPNRLVQLSAHDFSDGTNIPAFCFPVFEGLTQRAKSFQGLFTWHGTTLSLGQGVDAETIPAGVASGDAFRTLGIRPQTGRLFGPSDDTSTADAVAVVSEGFWSRRYGRSYSLIGRRILLDRHPFTVVGVLPASFQGMSTATPVDIVIPFHADAVLHPQWDMLHTTRIWWIGIFGRLRGGVSQAQATAEVRTLSHAVLENIDVHGVNGSPFSEARFTLTSAAQGSREAIQRYDKPLYVLICVAFSVLLIGCLNIANLLLARGVKRERDLSVRLTLGASRLRIVRHLVMESLLLSGIGTILGAALAIAVSRASAHFIAAVEIKPDLRLVGFVGGIAAIVSVLFGLLPAIRSTRVKANGTLKLARIGRSFERVFLGKTLVCVQVAISLTLVAAAFLFVKSFATLTSQAIGIDRKNLAFIGLDSERSGMKAPDLANFYEELLAGVRALPYVQSASLIAVAPLSGGFEWHDLTPKAYPNLTREQRQLYIHHVAPQYFRTVGVSLLEGRDFDTHDSTSKEKIGILSQAAAKLYFPGQSAVGQVLRDEDSTNVRIVGVVRDAKYQSMRDPAPQTMYVPAIEAGELPGNAFMSGSVWNLAIRASAPAATVASAVRAMIRKTNKDVYMNGQITLDQSIDNALAIDRLMAILASSFAMVGCVLRR